MDFAKRLTAIWARFEIVGTMAEMRPTIKIETDQRGDIVLYISFIAKCTLEHRRMYFNGISTIPGRWESMSDQTAIKMIQQFLRNIWDHEFDESIKIDGDFLTDPHPVEPNINDRGELNHGIEEFVRFEERHNNTFQLDNQYR